MSDIKAIHRDATDDWFALLTSEDGEKFEGVGDSRDEAICNARESYREKLLPLQSLTADKAEWLISTKDNPKIAGLGYEIDPNSNYTVAQHASHLQKLMTELIEKAKREGLDGRLLAMANTDFERGFMALGKALTTNKG